MTFARKFSWTRDQVNQMTLRDVKIHLMTERELKAIGETPRTKSGRKAMKPTIDRAVKNIMAGREWNA